MRPAVTETKAGTQALLFGRRTWANRAFSGGLRLAGTAPATRSPTG
jgi:hypothetical protein